MHSDGRTKRGSLAEVADEEYLGTIFFFGDAFLGDAFGFFATPAGTDTFFLVVAAVFLGGDESADEKSAAASTRFPDRVDTIATFDRGEKQRIVIRVLVMSSNLMGSQL
jgi:hypothetical protein